MANTERPEPFFQPDIQKKTTRRSALPIIFFGLPLVATGAYAVTNPDSARRIGAAALKVITNPNFIPVGEQASTPTPATPSSNPNILSYKPGEAVGHAGPEIFTLHIPDNEKTLLRNVTALPVGSKERQQAEENLRGKATSPDQIRAALLVTNDQLTRTVLREAYFNAINKPELGAQLPQDVKKWGIANLTDANGVPYHSIGLTQMRRTYRATREVIGALLPYYIQTKQVGADATAAMVMPTPGGAALILGTESSMFVGIGSVPAIDHIDRARFASGGIDIEQNLRDTIKRFEAQTGVPYPVSNFPGNKSGALGQDQVMPFRADEIYKDLQRVGITYNPFDIEQAYLPIAILLAKGGYRAGNSNANNKAVRKWTEQYGDKIVAADTSYRAAFPQELT